MAASRCGSSAAPGDQGLCIPHQAPLRFAPPPLSLALKSGSASMWTGKNWSGTWTRPVFGSDPLAAAPTTELSVRSASTGPENGWVLADFQRARDSAPNAPGWNGSSTGPPADFARRLSRRGLGSACWARVVAHLSAARPLESQLRLQEHLHLLHARGSPSGREQLRPCPSSRRVTAAHLRTCPTPPAPSPLPTSTAPTPLRRGVSAATRPHALPARVSSATRP
jgi:hypothetical protein